MQDIAEDEDYRDKPSGQTEAGRVGEVKPPAAMKGGVKEEAEVNCGEEELSEADAEAG